MIKAVLLDLDNTLLKNSDSVFVAEYLRLVDTYFQKRWDIPGLSHLLRSVIRVSVLERDMQQTNAQLAQKLITESTGKAPEAIIEAFTDFYTEAYPQLQTCVEPVAAAVPLYDFLRAQGYAVVIATNPLYPPNAIQQRLAWAGLPSEFSAYALITHSDNMHSAKPDPAYYAEVVARVGIEPDEAVMVGDSLRNDIEPAAQIGLNTYLITEDGSTLKDFFEVVTHDNWLEKQVAVPLAPAAIEPELRGNMGALFGLLNEVKPHQWNQHPDPNEWSILQIVCHLLDSEQQVQQPRLRRILNENNPFLVQPQAPPGPREAVPCDVDGWHAAQQWADLRQQTIAWLRQLSDEDWQRPARHSIFGLTSLLEMAHFTAQHDRLHINQLCQTLGRCQ